ncbi:MAG: hypothetical protein BHV99_02320 [Clostridium sp. 26_21]|nr:MAG: hypothetical protein BHV99_02320 [Clostridium sp. 26_21]
MKNKMIKRIILCAFILMFYVLTNKVQANSIEKIEMDIDLDENGDATVIETWQANLTQGTEGYRPFFKLQDSKILDFSVTDESERKYQLISDWNTNGSFDYKSYKCGMKETSNGVELCWGISQYGNKIYTLKYKINKLVIQYTDCQGIYFNFLKLNQDVNKVVIKIHCNNNLSVENSKIWSYGYKGTINFENGDIVLDSKGELSKSQYMVGLIKFENNIFSTNNKSNLSFEDVKKSAKSDMRIFVNVILTIISILLNPFTIFIIVILISIIKGANKKTIVEKSVSAEEPLNILQEDRRLPADDKVEYYREIPCDKDLEVTYWVCYQYYVSADSVLKKGIVGAIFLKWFKEGKIAINKNQNKKIEFKDNNYSIDLSKIEYGENEVENSLIAILKSAAGKNEILEPNELKNWCKYNYENMKNWFDNILNYTERKLLGQGLITKGYSDGIAVRNVSPKLKEEALKLKGLRRFLLDYSLISEKEYIEVQIWEEYLIFAQLLGVADKVQEQFSKLYPNFKSDTILDMSNTTSYIDNLVDCCFEGIREAERMERAHDNDGFGPNPDGAGGSSNPFGGGSAGGSSGGGFR